MQRRRLEVLGLVDDDDLALQRTAAQERHRLQRQLAAAGQLLDHPAGVAAGAVVGEGDDRVVDRRHPRVELLVESAGQVADVGSPDRNERAVHGEALVAAVFDDLLEPGGDGQHGLAGAGPAVEGDHLDRRVEQQLEGEALLLGARPAAPTPPGRCATAA